MYFSSHHLASSIILMVVNLCTSQLIWGYCGMLEKNKQPYRVQIPSTALALRRKGRYLRQEHYARKTAPTLLRCLSPAALPSLGHCLAHSRPLAIVLLWMYLPPSDEFWWEQLSWRNVDSGRSMLAPLALIPWPLLAWCFSSLQAIPYDALEA